MRETKSSCRASQTQGLSRETTYANVGTLQDFQKNNSFLATDQKSKTNAILLLENERNVHFLKKKQPRTKTETKLVKYRILAIAIKFLFVEQERVSQKEIVKSRMKNTRCYFSYKCVFVLLLFFAVDKSLASCCKSDGRKEKKDFF